MAWKHEYAGMVDEVLRAEEDVQVIREIIAYMKLHAEELRTKGVPVDDMVRDLERQIAEFLTATKKVRALQAEDELLTQKREHLRRAIDSIPGLPPDLTDGMATVSYLHGASEREAERKRRGKKGVGG